MVNFSSQAGLDYYAIDWLQMELKLPYQHICSYFSTYFRSQPLKLVLKQV